MSLIAGSACADVTLTPDNANFNYSSYAHITVNSSMARFDRIISNGLTYDNPGARVRFRTDATSATATVFYNSLTTQFTCSIGTILVNGLQVGTYTVGGTRGTVNITIPPQGTATMRTVELVMPYWDSVDFTGLTVNTGANFEAPPAKPSVRWVAYGDSITQGGYAAVNPFVEKVARANGWESVNMGFGGDTIQPNDGFTLGSLGANVITEMMGHNNAGSTPGTTAAAFVASMTTWVNNVRNQQPNVPIYLISPLYTSNPYSALLASYGPALQTLVNNSGDPNLHYIDGMSLGINSGNSATYLADGVHPNEAGAALIASNLAGQISTTSVVTPGTTVQSTYFKSDTTLAYNPSTDDVVATDLVLTGQTSFAGCTSSEAPASGFTLAGLTDGTVSTSLSSPNATFWNTTWPVTLTFNLNTNPSTGGCATGYTISKIETIAGWTVPFVDQRYTVWVKTVGSSSYVQLGGNFVDPTVTGSTNSTKTIITDSTGTLASNVQSVQLVYSTPVSGSNALVLQEVAICGVSNSTVHASYSNSTSNLAYTPSADGVLGTDLVLNGQSSFANCTSDVTPFSGFTVAGLTDGAVSTSDASKSTFWQAGWPVTLTFNLNTNPATGGCATGYKISKIETIGGWTGTFVDQRYTVWVKAVGSSSYVQVGGNFFDPSVGSSTTSSRTVITDSTGTLAAGAQSVKLVYTAPVNGSANALVIQEVAICGAADTTLQTTYSNSATSMAYSPSADGVLANDLVLTGQPSFAGCSSSITPSGGFPLSGMTDGCTSPSNTSKATYFSTGWPVTLTFDLNVNPTTGGCAAGYNISEIETIAGWSSGFVDQRYSLWIKTVGSSSYVRVGGNFLDATVTGSTNSTRTVITDSTGTIATGVQSVQLVYSTPAQTSGQVVIQEVAICGTAVSGPVLQATYSNSGTQGAYMSDISNTDLINNGQATYAGGSMDTTPTGGAFTGLTDGLGTTLDAQLSRTLFKNGSWPTTLTFNLNLNPGTGGNASGYDISKVQTIGGWTIDFVDQRYTLWVKKVGSSSYTQVGGNFLDPTVVTGTTKSTKTVITESTGPIATNVQSVQLVYSAPVQGTSATVVIQEIDVFGTASAPTNTFSNWAAGYPSLSDTTPGGNPSHDGLSNLVKYALGLDPTKSAQPAGTRTGSSLTFTKGTMAKADSNIAYSIEESTDLSTWGAPTLGSSTNGADTISYTFPNGRTKVFARLKVIQTP